MIGILWLVPLACCAVLSVHVDLAGTCACAGLTGACLTPGAGGRPKTAERWSWSPKNGVLVLNTLLAIRVCVYRLVAITGPLVLSRHCLQLMYALTTWIERHCLTPMPLFLREMGERIKICSDRTAMRKPWLEFRLSLARYTGSKQCR